MTPSLDLLDVMCREISLSPGSGARFSVELDSALHLLAMRGHLEESFYHEGMNVNTVT